MDIKEFDVVIAVADIPDSEIKAGTRGVVVDDHGGGHYEVEFMDENHDAIDIEPVSRSYLRLVASHQPTRQAA